MAKTWTFTVPGVKTKQRPRHAGRRVYTPKATAAYEALVSFHASISGVQVGRREACEVRCRIWTPDRRKRDIDNILKIILDGLVSVGALDDDTITVVRKLSGEWMGVDKENPRVEVTVRVLELGRG